MLYFRYHIYSQVQILLLVSVLQKPGFQSSCLGQIVIPNRKVPPEPLELPPRDGLEPESMMATPNRYFSISVILFKKKKFLSKGDFRIYT